MHAVEEIGRNFSVLFDVYKHAVSSVNGFWTFFNGVSAATIALAFTGRVTIPKRGKQALAVAYLVFALINNYLIWHAQCLSFRSAALVREFPLSSEDAKLKQVLGLIHPMNPWLVSAGHFVIMSAVLLGILMAHRRDEPTKMGEGELFD